MKESATQSWLDLQFGMFIHFGLYSIPGGVWNNEVVKRGYSEQILSHGYLPQADYEALAEQFTIDHFDADHIVMTAKAAGMRYLVITSKHHDGFCLFNTKTTSYQSKRDIVAELSEACKRHGLAFGIYFSWIDWHFPEALPISSHNSDTITPEHQRLNIRQLTELLTGYGPICELWMDMGAPSKEQSREVYDLVQNLQPDCMVNGRIWNDYQDFLTMGDNELPAVALDCPWQTPASIYKETWGYRSWQVRGDKHEKIKELSATARRVIEGGGNYLLNIGLVGDGSIQEFEEAVLKGIGKELAGNPPERKTTTLQIPEKEYQGPSFACGEPVVVYRYTGAEYYSYRPIPTSLHWKIALEENKKLSIYWRTTEPLEKEEKLVLVVDGKPYYSSLQKGRHTDAFITSLPLQKGKHEFIVHTVGSPLKRPALGAHTLQIVLEEESR